MGEPICTKCGAELVPGTSYCHQCGQPTDESTPRSEQATAILGESKDAATTKLLDPRPTAPGYEVNSDSLTAPSPAGSKRSWITLATIVTLLLLLVVVSIGIFWSLRAGSRTADANQINKSLIYPGSSTNVDMSDSGRAVLHLEIHDPHQAGHRGTISGIVVDTEGKPVSQATVEARILRSFTGPSIPAQADKQGRFTMTRLEAETYELYAAKEEDGYAESPSTFYVGAKSIVRQITLNENEVSSGNVIRVGPKALKLFGHVVDAVTKKPVGNGRITMRRVDDPRAFFQTGVHGSFTVLVPQVPITVEVTAPGYEKTDLGTLTLKAEQINRLEVLLRKSQ